MILTRATQYVVKVHNTGGSNFNVILECYMHTCKLCAHLQTHFLMSNNNTIKSYTIYQIVTIVIFTSFVYSFGGMIIGVRMAVFKAGF